MAFRVRHLWVFFLAAVVLTPAVVWAQPGGSGGARVYEEQLRVAIDEQNPAAREVGFDAGGWFSFAFLNYNDVGGGRWRSLSQFQLRPWASLNVNAVHEAYFRGLIGWDVWGSGDNPRWWRGSEFTDTVERAWYRFNLSQLIKQETGQAPPVDFSIKVGRDFTTIGTAFVLSQTLDLVEIDVGYEQWKLRAFLGKTLHHSDNLDQSWTIDSRQERTFWGAEVSYSGLDAHRPFVYFLSQKDHSSPSVWNPGKQFDIFNIPGQRYDYSSSYVGIGSVGYLGTPDLTYLLEFVGEWGKTFSWHGVDSQDEICAQALDVQLEYHFRVATNPRVQFEYIYASGDGDRETSSTSTVGGNRLGTRDRAFNAFGFRDTGIAFSPEISNIHIYSLGLRCNPLETFRFFKKLELGTKVFFYHKDRRGGASGGDWTLSNDSSWLGWEWDVYMNWRLTSDLAVTARYGMYRPGAAVGGQFDKTRHFLYTGVVLSF